MRRPVSAFLMVFAILAAGAVGLVVGRSNSTLAGWLDGLLPAAAKQSPAQSEATGPIIYYRNPDGLLDYSLTPKKTSAGKDYLAVRSSEDVRIRWEWTICPSMRASRTTTRQSK